MADLVVDTGPLLEGFAAGPETRCLVPRAVLAELERHGMTGYEVENRGLVPTDPDPAALGEVDRAARATGDAGVLSQADRAVLAVALAQRAPLLSDDYAVQNVARALGLEARGHAQRGIRSQWAWEWHCTACRSHVGEEPGECPVCGTMLRRRPKGAARRQ